MLSKKSRLASARLLAPSNLGGSRVGAAPASLAVGVFRTDCDAAIHRIRLSLERLAEAAGCDLLRPQEVSRRFGLNKNLTWKFARVLLAEDSFDAVAMIPRAEGVEIFLRAFESARVSAPCVDAVRDAIREFEAVVTRHFGDRGQLELVLDGLRSDGNLEQSRRTAFRGMTGVFGVQAAVRLTAQIISPSANAGDPADYTLIVGLAGLQRLRPIGALPVFRASGSTTNPLSASQPLITSSGCAEPEFLLRDFSTFPDSTVTAAAAPGGGLTAELSEGPIGRIGQSDLYFASVTRGAMQLRSTPDDAEISLVTRVSIPTEALLSDLFVHRSMAGLETLRTSIHSTLSQPLSDDPRQRELSLLPIQVTPIVVEDLAAGFGTRGVPGYEEMVGRAFDALGADRAEFRLIRVAMEFPPAPSALLVSWDVPQ